jgi:hypothetical protein
LTGSGQSTLNDLNVKRNLTIDGVTRVGNLTGSGQATLNDLNVKRNLTVDGTVNFGKYAKFEAKTDFYGQLCMRSNNTDVCMTGSDMANLLKLSQAPATVRSMTGLVISHPDGRTVKNNNNTLQLNRGSAATFDIYNNPAVNNNKNGRVALIQGGDMSKAMRHSGYIIYTNPFSVNNSDFSWHIRANGTGFDIYNDYGGGTYLGYDAKADTLRVVPVAEKVTWRISPLPPANLVFS